MKVSLKTFKKILLISTLTLTSIVSFFAYSSVNINSKQNVSAVDLNKVQLNSETAAQNSQDKVTKEKLKSLYDEVVKLDKSNLETNPLNSILLVLYNEADKNTYVNLLTEVKTLLSNESATEEQLNSAYERLNAFKKKLDENYKDALAFLNTLSYLLSDERLYFINQVNAAKNNPNQVAHFAQYASALNSQVKDAIDQIATLKALNESQVSRFNVSLIANAKTQDERNKVVQEARELNEQITALANLVNTSNLNNLNIEQIEAKLKEMQTKGIDTSIYSYLLDNQKKLKSLQDLYSNLNNYSYESSEFDSLREEVLNNFSNGVLVKSIAFEYLNKITNLQQYQAQVIAQKSYDYIQFVQAIFNGNEEIFNQYYETEFNKDYPDLGEFLKSNSFFELEEKESLPLSYFEKFDKLNFKNSNPLVDSAIQKRVVNFKENQPINYNYFYFLFLAFPIAFLLAGFLILKLTKPKFTKKK
ncbi:GA module-containing protein [Mycoplasmopsis synoviae]|uniref:GA module-containing protein n=1 Tax=Mycoplasmopsis synoviae TaxID=2109 RepID=UPI001CE1D75A|nr:GA module-containing protein [Mycoplasmopsis synoviae]UBX98522.1 GA module-containing protein [Mycoplasmopsis synoviae]